MPIATLDELILAVRAEIGDSTNLAMGVDSLPGFRQLLNRIQESYYLDHDWPNLVFDSEEQVKATERYYTFNEGLNFERIFRAEVFANNQWYPLQYGINSSCYNSINSDAGQTDTYPRRWDHYGENQFEVWPVPSQASKIRFRAVRALQPMKSGTDKCMLDSTLLILAAASEMAMRHKLEDAKLKLGLLTAHYNRLKGRLSKGRVFSMIPQQPMMDRGTPRAPRL